MRITHRVYDSRDKLVGYIIDGNVYNELQIIDNIALIENAKLNKQGKIKITGDDIVIDITASDANKQYAKRLKLDNKLIDRKEIQKSFKVWKNKLSMLSLFVTGKPCVGKTTEVKLFAYNNYEHVVYIDLANEYIRKEFEDCVCRLDNKVFAIANFCNTVLRCKYYNDKNTVLILDSINESVKAIKEFYQLHANLGCNIIVINNYKDNSIVKLNDNGAGFVYMVDIDCLSFKEFCLLMNKSKLVNRIETGNMSKRDPATANELIEVYKKIGGYPTVVRTYLQTGNIDECNKVLDSIIDSITAKVIRACKASQNVTSDVLEQIFKNILYTIMVDKSGTKNSLSQLELNVQTVLTGVAKKIDVDEVFNWLLRNKVLISLDYLSGKTYNELQKDKKVYFTDCGLAYNLFKLYEFKDGQKSKITNEQYVVTELEKKAGIKVRFAVTENAKMIYLKPDGLGNNLTVEIAGNYEKVIMDREETTILRVHNMVKRGQYNADDLINISMYELGIRW